MANCVQCGRKLSGFTFGRKICPWCVQHEAAKRGEEGDDAVQQVMPTPWVRQGESTITLTHVILGANVAVFAAMVLASGSIDSFSGKIAAHFGANVGPYTLSGQWWRLFTYMFLHGGVVHIAMNMWCLWSIGALCESLYGRWTYAAIYVITGISGGLASVVWNPGVLSVGASGALFGLSGALIASIYLGEFSLAGISLKGTLSSLLFFTGFSLFAGRMFPGIDNACHVGGLVSGLALGALIALFAPDQSAAPPRLGVIAVVALAVFGAWFGLTRWRSDDIRMARAMRAVTENDPARMIEQLRAIVHDQPNFSQAHFALAQALFNQERYAEAEPEFKRVLELQPGNLGARFNLGMVYLSEKKFPEATALYAQAIANDKDDADAHYGLALVLADQDKNAEAIEEFKTAARLGPHVSGLYYDLGNAYARLNKMDDAIAAFQQHKKVEGDSPDLESALAAAYGAKGMKQEAQEANQKAAQLRGGARNP